MSRRRLDGVLLLDKAAGMSSNHALQAVRRLFNAEKAGHTGTLDPLATGLLPACFGEATKFSAELLDADKRYRATVQLGTTTTTADAEGDVVLRRSASVSADEIRKVLEGFLGEIDQVPPMHSALKRDGRPLYEYARAGIDIARAPRRVRIHSLRLGAMDLPLQRFEFDVTCSKGTYVRTLAADIGEKLGCGAHLAGLRRTGIGRLDVGDAISQEALEAMTPSGRDGLLLPVDALLSGLAEARLDVANAARLSHGQPVRWSGTGGTRYRTYADGEFLGLCLLGEDGWLRPQRLLAGN